MKPGYKTTEFWLSVAAAVFGALLSSGVLSDSTPLLHAAHLVVGALVMLLATMGYTWSRANTKAENAKAGMLSGLTETLTKAMIPGFGQAPGAELELPFDLKVPK